MDSYSALLEKIHVPQSSLQKLAVISIFSKLRSAPKYLDSESEPGRDAISQCLHTDSPAVLDQSVRELCRFVVDSHMDVSRALLEFQSALEGSHPRFVDLFVKGLGFLVRFGFRKSHVKWRSCFTESHPFVKVLACRSEVQRELVQQVLLLMTQYKKFGMVEICEFLRPFLIHSILRIPFSDTSSSMFARHLISLMSSFCCTFPLDSVPVFRLLTESHNYLPLRNAEDFRNFAYHVEHMVDAYIVVLRHSASTRMQNFEAQQCGLELLETIFSLYLCHHKQSGFEIIVELSRRVLVAQKDLGLHYVPKLSSLLLSLFVILLQSELEHEQLPILNLLRFILKWKYGNEYVVGREKCALSEELLLIFPIVSLCSSPSRSVKGAATDILVILENLLVELSAAVNDKPEKEERLPYSSTPGSVAFRLLQNQWFQDQFPSSFFLRFASSVKIDGKASSWASQLREYTSCIVDRRKHFPQRVPQHIFTSEMPLLLCAIAGVLVMHWSLGSSAVDSLTSIGIMDPKQGSQLLLLILFYSNIFTRKDVVCPDMSLKLLGVLPAIASHSVMMPLIVQTILPMLQKDAKPTLYATAIRLLCQTWEINDRAFRSLQEVLLPKGILQFKSERNICISMAASIRDVSRKSPDRGVDLILSVAACIESKDPVVQALGFQSLAHLCEADVIDFYTAWDVISKHVLDYSLDSVLAQSLCILLRWGAMDAEAYPESSEKVLKILWDIITSVSCNEDLQFAKVRISALESLAQYEVSQIEQKIPDFKKRYMELLFAERNIHVLRAMEELQVKIIKYEHTTRRRLVKEKRAASNKIEKLLDVFPQVIFSSGKRSNARDFPGAALLCLSFTPKDTQGVSKGLRDVHKGYKNAFTDLAASIQLSRNIFLALVSLQSWKSFMRRWLRADVVSLDAKATPVILDKITKAADDILKTIIQIAQDAIPRSAENIALAIGALCLALPPSVHTVKSSSSKFLLNWLFQYEHEHYQWSAAISLGLISSCLHVTDHKQKFQNITGLLKVLCDSKSAFVKGACGLGLGFSCQDLLTRFETSNNSDFERETYKMSEVDLMGRIIRALLLTICLLTKSSFDVMDDLFAYFPSSIYDIDTIMSTESHENCNELEEDILGVAGLVFGLASLVGVIYRTGAHDAVLKIKSLIMSWIPHVNSLSNYTSACSEVSEILLSVGSCLALPIVVAFCLKVELISFNEVDHLMSGYKDLISELLSIKKSGALYQSLMIASCMGAGNLLGCTLQEGVQPVTIEYVKVLLELFRKCYSNPYPPLVHFGGMLGVVNAMGANAGILVHMHPSTTYAHTSYEYKESSYLIGPLLSSPLCEQHLTPLLQEIFLIAQNSDDPQLQQHAAWAASLLRNRVWSKEDLNEEIGIDTETTSSKPVFQSFAKDSTVMMLSSWLMNLKSFGTDNIMDIGMVVTMLRCLSQAPRLPAMDWGAIIRRCMRYEAQVANLLKPDPGFEKGSVREECIRFSISHANQFDSLLNFLDELSDLARFRTLELNLQCCLLVHFADLIKLFSGSRLEKLFDDLTNYLSSITLQQVYDTDKKSMIRISCWKGLHRCLEEASLDSLEYISNAEKCMEVLFSLLPPLPQSAAMVQVVEVNFTEEWSEAVRCLGKARQSWLLDYLQVSQEDLLQENDQSMKVFKKIQAKAKLVSIGSIQPIELGRLKAHLLNSKLHGMWDVLIEVAAALHHADGSVRRQWLIDAVEISCVSIYPSTALQFISLLSGSFSKYMPLMILDPHSVLGDLPVTLGSLLSESGWENIAESVVSYLWASTERIYSWNTMIIHGEDTSSIQPIDESENEMTVFLLHVMHRTCLSLKDYLPFEKQLKLANMVVP